MAYVTRYIFGTDKLRRNAFEVRGLNGARTGVIHCDDSAILSQWLKYITDNITGLTHLQVTLIMQLIIILPHVFLFTVFRIISVILLLINYALVT